MTTSPNSLNKHDLRQFTGTEHWYRHSMVRQVLFTDGVKYVADEGGAYWLVDAIAFAQVGDNKAVAAEAFQLWKLMVRPDATGTLTCEDGNGNAVYTQELAFTDFPLDEITLYFTSDVIMLPSEY